MSETNLRRALRVIALTNAERMDLLPAAMDAYNQRFHGEIPEPQASFLWFVEHIDDLAPALHERGWVERRPFDEQPGSVVVTTGQGDIRMLVITELGRAQLNAAVA